MACACGGRIPITTPAGVLHICSVSHAVEASHNVTQAAGVPYPQDRVINGGDVEHFLQQVHEVWVCHKG